MKKLALSLFIFFFVPNFTLSAPRSIVRAHPLIMLSKSPSHNRDNQQHVSEKERDYLMFTNFVGIVINFAKLFMDPHNIPEAKQNAYNILNGINNLAHVITRSKMSKQTQEELILKIIEQCKKVTHT